ncbi:MAG: adenosylcobalamin-dependent ribonucleoside-diphosphate reductase [Myxococcota bacterium]
MPEAQSDAARLAALHSQVAAPGETSLADVAGRVASAVAEAEPVGERAEWAERFAAMIRETAFLPSVPTLANAGRGGQLAACFVLDVADSLESIYGTLHRAARIQQGSGGVGVEFSALRPRGAPIARSGGHAPGVLAFAELFARSAHVMTLAGRRAGAHLAILRDDHPDIVEFVRAKRQAPERFPNMGLAVGITDQLLRAARAGEMHGLRHVHGGSGGHVRARDLLLEIARSILETGDPTLLFLDRINADNPTPELGALCATNPCGEQPLLPNESCVLGSLHLPLFVGAAGAGMDWGRLEAAVRESVRFLDDVIDVNAHPDGEIERATRATRKVGLGTMGLADVLLMLGLPYGSSAARTLTGEILARVSSEARRASVHLGERRGTFADWRGRGPARRNATTCAVAPTGTVRLLAGASAGIEPWIAPVIGVDTDEGVLRWSDRWLTVWLERRGADTKHVLDSLAAGRSFRSLQSLSASDQFLLRRAWEIPAQDQLAMQAAAQRFVDGAVSKTVHLDAARRPSPEELTAWTQRARELGCKGTAFFCRSADTAPLRIDLRLPCPTCPQ